MVFTNLIGSIYDVAVEYCRECTLEKRKICEVGAKERVSKEIQ